MKDEAKFTLLEGDCIEAMSSLEPESVDAVVTDPPYGLEFMGKAWDRFRLDDPGTVRNRGKRVGSQGKIVRRDGRRGPHPARRNVSYGGGKHPITHRCMECGRRDQRRSSHEPCGAGKWRREPIDPHVAPPSSLAFQEWCRLWALEAKRVLKPGGHLLAFASPRLSHRLICGLEDGGFEIRDCIAWINGSGFPKSLDVAKAIEARAAKGDETAKRTAQSTEAGRWQGWGTALKPAYEPIVVARKPLVGTVAANVLEYETGAINVDACRIGAGDGGDRDGEDSAERRYSRSGSTDFALAPGSRGGAAGGRWPANVVLSHLEQCVPGGAKPEGGSDGGEPAEAWNCAPGCPIGELDTQSGLLTTGCLRAGTQREGLGYRGGLGTSVRNDFPANEGSASRFFYCAKASRAEREAGLEGFEAKTADLYGEHRGRRMADKSRIDGKAAKRAANHHPTVKPISLMRWLLRLVTPPGGVVLDPFLGSGSTGCAAALEGLDFIGIEREPEYCRIAEARWGFWGGHLGCDVKDVLERERRARRRCGLKGELGRASEGGAGGGPSRGSA